MNSFVLASYNTIANQSQQQSWWCLHYLVCCYLNSQLFPANRLEPSSYAAIPTDPNKTAKLNHQSTFVLVHYKLKHEAAFLDTYFKAKFTILLVPKWYIWKVLEQWWHASCLTHNPTHGQDKKLLQIEDWKNLPHHCENIHTIWLIWHCV